MPKETFYNLSDDKKRKIFDAAVLEFSTRRFSEASINQIVKTAGIPRGSFYQYFNDKEDIYLYMFTEIEKEKRYIISRTGALKPDANFFDAYMHNAKVFMEWSKAKPEYSRIGMLMEMDDSAFIGKLREISTEGFDRLKGMIERDKQRGLIKPEVDSGLVGDMIFILVMNFVKEYYQTGPDEDIFLKRISDMFKIINEGIANN